VHHIIPWGLERGHIVADGQDCDSVVARLGLSSAEAAQQPWVSSSGIAKSVETAERREVH
jgi:hypothetical protein